MQRVTIAALLTCMLALDGCIPPELLEELMQDTPTTTTVQQESDPTSAGAAIAAGSVSLMLPPGWEQTSIQDQPDVAIVRPEGVDDTAVRLAIPPGEEFRGNPMDWAHNRWGELPIAKVGERIRQGRTEHGQEWVVIAAELHMGIDGMKPVLFQTFANGTRMQPFLWFFRDEESLHRYGADVDRIATSVRFLSASQRPAPRNVAFGSLVPRACPGCIYTFTGAPPTTPAYLVGSWSMATTPPESGGYGDRHVYTFRANGTYEYSTSVKGWGGLVITRMSGRYRVDGNQLTLERLQGEQDNNGQVRQLGPETTTHQWRPALDFTRQPIVVIRTSSAHDWESFSRSR